MIRCASHDITFQEVPDEISLTLSISNCPGNCEGCHSPWLHDDIGYDLEENLPDLLDRYGELITCVCLMGEGKDPAALLRCIKLVKERNLKVCLYSGRDLIKDIPLIEEILPLLDYLKVGSYQSGLGGLDSTATNQQMYKFDQKGRIVQDITFRFWENKEWSFEYASPHCQV